MCRPVEALSGRTYLTNRREPNASFAVEFLMLGGVASVVNKLFTLEVGRCKLQVSRDARL